MLLGLTVGQRLVLAGMAVVFVVFALISAFLLPRWRPDFPGERGVRWFVVASLVLFVAMMTTVILVREEEEEGHGAAEAAAVEDVTETGEDDGAGTGGAATTGGDAAAGAEVFASAGCGGCHVFAAAETRGAIGPNLDESSIDFEGAVTQIRNGGDGMPPFGQELSDEQIANVAAFVVERREG